MKEFAVFWGCTIPARFPFIEKATRVMFDDLGATVHELAGHTCCPEGTLVKANDPEAFYTAAARNLAIIEKAGLGVVTPCNGCYSTFKEAQSHLRTDWREREAVNERLAKRGAALRQRHRSAALRRVAVRLDGRGARRLRRQEVVLGHAPGRPLRVPPAASAARGALGRPAAPQEGRGDRRARSARRVVDYPTKMQCCGGALDRVGQRESSLAFCRRKLYDLQNNDVDALVVVCPSCFQQFDLNQAALQRANENINVPVLYLSELIALAYGHEPEETRPRHAPRERPAVPRQVGVSGGGPRRARCRLRRRAAEQVRQRAAPARTTARSARSTRRSSPTTSSATWSAATSTR